MTEIFEGIDKKFIKNVADIMDKDGVDYLDISFNEFKELIHCKSEAKSIKTINQSITIRMNEVAPCNWFFKVGSRINGEKVHISRIKKEVYYLD